MVGYTRQSAADIIPGADITAANHNNEYNAIQAAFNVITGHTHSGAVGEGAPILPTGLAGITSDGIVVRVSPTQFAPRSISGTANEIVVTNGDGISANPTIGLPDQIAPSNGVVTAPTYAFASDLDTGFYRLGDGAVGVASNGFLAVSFAPGVVTFQNNGGQSFLQLRADSSAGPPVHQFLKARGTTTSPTTLIVNDQLLRIDGSGHDGTTYLTPTSIIANTYAPISTGIMPTQLTFQGTATGAASKITMVTMAADNTAALPVLTLVGDLDTGLYHPSSNNLGIAAGGAQIVNINTSGVQVTGDITGTSLNVTGAAVAGSISTTGGISATGATITGAISGTSLSVTGPATFTTGLIYRSITVGIAAAGTTQGTATPLTTSLNTILTATAGVNDGVVLPAATSGGAEVRVFNTSAATINVYPSVGRQINALGTNVADTLAAGSSRSYYSTTLTQWRT